MDGYCLRYMQITDIPSVMALERQSFSTPWSVRSYRFEISQSNYSHMVVLEHTQAPPAPANPMVAWWQAITGHTRPAHTLLAYGGFWNFGGRAHISTIASNPHFRRQGYGELVLLAMIRRAGQLAASVVTLEVRVSNTGAQQLYRKHGFRQRGIKAGYYTDNQEDAYDMILPLSPPGHLRRAEQRLAEHTGALGLQDAFTNRV